MAQVPYLTQVFYNETKARKAEEWFEARGFVVESAKVRNRKGKEYIRVMALRTGVETERRDITKK